MVVPGWMRTLLVLGGCAVLTGGCGHAPERAPAPEADPTPVRLSVVAPNGSRSFYVMLGTQVPLSVRARDASGREVRLPAPVRFVSRDPGVVSVDSAGMVSSVSMGETHVIAETAAGGRVLMDSVRIGVECTAELRLRYTPAPPEAVIRVGETFTPSLELSTCGGLVRVQQTLTWRARDPRIIRVDPATGRTTGLAPGETWIEVTGTVHRSLDGFRVTVRP